MQAAGDWAPPIFLSPSFAAAASDDGDTTNEYLAQFLENSENLRAKLTEPRPHPEQGGHQITLEWLQEWNDRECLWTFRYMISCRKTIWDHHY